MPELVKAYESRGGKYRYELFRDEQGFTHKEYQDKRLAGGGSFGAKPESEVLAYVANYLRFFPSKMREV